MKCASRHLSARSKNHGFSVAAKQVKGVSVVNIKARPARAGGGTDDELGGGRGGADPADVVRLGAGTAPRRCGG